MSLRLEKAFGRWRARQ